MHTGQKGRLAHPYDLTFNYQIARSTDAFSDSLAIYLTCPLPVKWLSLLSRVFLPRDTKRASRPGGHFPSPTSLWGQEEKRNESISLMQ
jgi:hypothetical protein